eukprot:896200-Rhodomonas_salina.1
MVKDGTTTTEEQAKQLSLADSLVPDSANRRSAMKQERFKQFWLDAEHKEWTGLADRECFKKWKRSDLLPSDLVFGSRYHYNIKHCSIMGKITKFK